MALKILLTFLVTTLGLHAQLSPLVSFSRATVFKAAAAGGPTDVELFNDNLNRSETPAASPWICLFSTTANREFNLDGADAIPELVSTDCGNFYTGLAIATNQWIEITCSASGTGTGAGIGMAVRIKDGSPDRTCYTVVMSKAASNNVRVSKYVARTQSGIVDYTQAWNDLDTWKVRCTGTTTVTIRVYLNGSQVGTDYTDASSPLQAGTVGIYYSSTMTTPKIHTARGGSYQ